MTEKQKRCGRKIVILIKLSHSNKLNSQRVMQKFNSKSELSSRWINYYQLKFHCNLITLIGNKAPVGFPFVGPRITKSLNFALLQLPLRMKCKNYNNGLDIFSWARHRIGDRTGIDWFCVDEQADIFRAENYRPGLAESRIHLSIAAAADQWKFNYRFKSQKNARVALGCLQMKFQFLHQHNWPVRNWMTKV